MKERPWKGYTLRMFRILAALLLALAVSPVGAESPPSGAPPDAAGGLAWKLLSEAEFPDFQEALGSRVDLVKAARKTLAYLEGAPPRTFDIAGRRYASGMLVHSLAEVIRLSTEAATQEEFADGIRRGFDVFQSAGSDGAGKVVFSSYYQPVLSASRKRTQTHAVPLYRRPPDMLEVDLAAFGRGDGEDFLIARVDKQRRVLPYFTRADIDIKKALAGKGLEVAWLRSKFDALDLHIQGSGILRFSDGKEVLAKYAGTNARPFSSVGLLLVRAGLFSRDELTRGKLREYLHEHPEAEDWILASNPRYTFFELLPLPADGEPFGTIEQSLVPARSIAFDPAVAPLGALVYFTTTSPQADREGRLLGLFPNARFAVAMDTGGAIKGPGRVDIYAGHGPQADTTARNQWAEGKLYLLIKKVPPRER